MAKRKKKKQHPRRPDRSVQAFYTPFEHLDQHLSLSLRIQPEKDGKKGECGSVKRDRDPLEEEDAFFLEAMADVRPLNGKGSGRVPAARPVKDPPRFLEQENLEVYRHLVGLVKGDASFDIWYSDEYVDGAVVGLSPKILKKLKNGDFSYRSHIDLHGHKCEAAYEKVVNFVQECFARKERCILIISGRGLNSKRREPVLKQKLIDWLTHAPLRRLVLAFASARGYDGGAGAFYVLLRNKAGKAPFKTPAT